MYQESSINGGLSGSEGARMAERKGKGGVGAGWLLQAARDVLCVLLQC